jgi:hypothetical protein
MEHMQQEKENLRDGLYGYQELSVATNRTLRLTARLPLLILLQAVNRGR